MRDVLLQLYRQLLPFWDNNPNFRAKYANQPDVLKTLAYLKKLDSEAIPIDAPAGAAAAVLMPPLPIKSALLLQLKTELEKLKATAKTNEFEKNLTEKVLEKFKDLKATADQIKLAEDYLKNLQTQALTYQQIAAFQSADAEDMAFIAASKKEQPTVDKKVQKLAFLVSIQNHNLVDEASKTNFITASKHLNENLETWQAKTANLEAKLATAKPDKLAEIKTALAAAKRGKETLEKLNTEIADLLNDPNYKIAIATSSRFSYDYKTEQEWFDDYAKYVKYHQIVQGNKHPENIAEIKEWIQEFEVFMKLNPSATETSAGRLISPGRNLGGLFLQSDSTLKVIADKPNNSRYLPGTIIHELVHAKQVRAGKLGHNVLTGNALNYLYDLTDEFEAFEAEFYANGGVVLLTGKSTNLTSLAEIQTEVPKYYPGLPATDNNADMTLQALGLSADVTAFCKSKNLQQAYNPTTLEAMTLRQILQGNTLAAQDLTRFKRQLKIGKIF